VKRREFITLLGGAAVAWPLAARAQQRERVRRVSVLMPFTADDPEGQARLLAFAQGLQQMGWAVGSNLRVDTRWGAGDAERNRKYAAELLALAPDVVVANGPLAVEVSNRRRTICRSCSRTCPILWVRVSSRACRRARYPWPRFGDLALAE
jgi:hypothetical protein